MTIERSAIAGGNPVPALDEGWYLYGVVRRGESVNLPSNLGVSPEGARPVLLIPCGSLAAVASPVDISLMGPAAIKERLRDAVWLETMVRAHQQVVERLHNLCTVLPSKFGTVYSSHRALSLAMAMAEEKLLAALGRVDDCEEWGVRLFADLPMVQRVARQYPAVRHLLLQSQRAKPGAAYFLRRKLDDILGSATQQALDGLAEAGYDHFCQCAISGQIGKPQVPATGSSEIEVLHCSFLVRRSAKNFFLQNVQLWLDMHDGLRCEYSGPWAPYSFAALGPEDACENR